MELIRMQATFGCLDDAVLELGPGLTTLCLPNGAGKSTWLAFVTAMFYGVDQGERKARGRLPVKSRYLPWSGKPMAGTIHLRRQGREIVLQRTSEGGRPLDTFRAYDPATGRTVDGLTGENCGPVLLGVEKAVFLRTACIIGEDLAVTPEAQLERRLQNLAATGRESDSARTAAETLQAWKNRCRSRRGGKIPEVEEQLRETEAALSQVEALRQARLACQHELRARREAIAGRAAAAQSALETARAALREAQTAAAGDPPAETLLRLQAALEQPDLQEPTALPPAIEGVRPEEIVPAARRALETVRRPLPRWGVQAAAAVLLLILGLVLLPIRQWWTWAVPALGLVALAWAVSALVRRRRGLARRRAVLDAWQAASAEELLPRAAACRDSLTAAWRQQVLLEEIRAFAPEAETPDQGRAAVAEALARRRAVEAAEAQVQAAAGRLWETPDNGAAAELQARAAALQAREEALGGYDVLEARAQALAAERQTLQAREAALTLALSALEAARNDLEAAYGPRLTAPAGQILRALTLGQLDGLVLENGQVLLVREASTGLTRPVESMSRGTQDQVWLALRLALSALLLPPETPLFLDDALLTFDEGRTAAALALLRQTGRQTLLFTCRRLETAPAGKFTQAAENCCFSGLNSV